MRQKEVKALYKEKQAKLRQIQQSSDPMDKFIFRKKLSSIKTSKYGDKYSYDFILPGEPVCSLFRTRLGPNKLNSYIIEIKDFYEINKCPNLLDSNLTKTDFQEYLCGEFAFDSPDTDRQKSFQLLLSHLKSGEYIGIAKESQSQGARKLLVVICHETKNLGRFLSSFCHIGVIMVNLSEKDNLLQGIELKES